MLRCWPMRGEVERPRLAIAEASTPKLHAMRPKRKHMIHTILHGPHTTCSAMHCKPNPRSLILIHCFVLFRLALSDSRAVSQPGANLVPDLPVRDTLTMAHANGPSVASSTFGLDPVRCRQASHAPLKPGCVFASRPQDALVIRWVINARFTRPLSVVLAAASVRRELPPPKARGRHRVPCRPLC